MERLEKPELYFIEKYTKWSNLRREIIDKMRCKELQATAFFWENQSSVLYVSCIRLEPSEGRQGCQAGLNRCTTRMVFNTKSISVTRCHLNALQPKRCPWSWAVPCKRADDFRVVKVLVRMSSVIIFFLWRVSWGLLSPVLEDLCKSLHCFSIFLGHPFHTVLWEWLSLLIAPPYS